MIKDSGNFSKYANLEEVYKDWFLIKPNAYEVKLVEGQKVTQVTDANTADSKDSTATNSTDSTNVTKGELEPKLL